MSKGEVTRARILDQALMLASRHGLDGLSLGMLSESLELSKSGLYAHFRSKEALVIAVLQHTRARYIEHMKPYVTGRAKGLDELRGHLAAWLDWIALPSLPAGCPILGASFEVEDLDGPTRDFVIDLTRASRERLATLLRNTIATGELRADTPVEQLLFEIRGIALSFHLECRLIKEKDARARADRALDDLLARYASGPG
ncbi:MAG: TetR/AcrR family transcriptional regulator [Polyangiaceae bacterium]